MVRTLVAEGRAGIVGDVGGISSLPCTDGIICGLMA